MRADKREELAIGNDGRVHVECIHRDFFCILFPTKERPVISPWHECHGRFLRPSRGVEGQKQQDQLSDSHFGYWVAALAAAFCTSSRVTTSPLLPQLFRTY